MRSLGSASESHIQSRIQCQVADDLRSATENDESLSDALFDRRITELLQVLVVNVVMADYGAGQDGIGIGLDAASTSFSTGTEVPR